jgi:hypothetical protein
MKNIKSRGTELWMFLDFSVYEITWINKIILDLRVLYSSYLAQAVPEEVDWIV